jgi:hypothetical protein
MSNKDIKGNKGNIKSSLNVGKAEQKIVDRIVAAVLGSPRPSGSSRQHGEELLSTMFGKRRHKRGWASM